MVSHTTGTAPAHRAAHSCRSPPFRHAEMISSRTHPMATMRKAHSNALQFTPRHPPRSAPIRSKSATQTASITDARRHPIERLPLRRTDSIEPQTASRGPKLEAEPDRHSNVSLDLAVSTAESLHATAFLAVGKIHYPAKRSIRRVLGPLPAPPALS